MPDRAIAVILAVSLIANIGMGAFIIERHWYGLDVAEESSPVPPGPFPVPQYLNTPDQLRRSAFLQGPAVLTTVGYIRRGQVLYQETNETGTTMNISVEIVPGEGRVLVHTTPLMGIVFQEAANTAVNVSQGRTRSDLGGERCDLLHRVGRSDFGGGWAQCRSPYDDHHRGGDHRPAALAECDPYRNDQP